MNGSGPPVQIALKISRFIGRWNQELVHDGECECWFGARQIVVGLENSMRAFWRQGLLIGIATVAVGCSNMSREERWIADGYPPDYVAGLEAGHELFCAQRFGDKSNLQMLLGYVQCMGKNLEMKQKKEVSDSQSYLLGKSDGWIRAFDAERRREQERQQRYYVPDNLMWDQMMGNMQAPNFNR